MRASAMTATGTPTPAPIAAPFEELPPLEEGEEVGVVLVVEEEVVVAIDVDIDVDVDVEEVVEVESCDNGSAQAPSQVDLSGRSRLDYRSNGSSQCLATHRRSSKMSFP